ncbi:MAG: TRAP transporter fused permease subunit [Firmicutes bacterium]|nr:TRAP transporter fused permease subunit [Bacillota bacterium]
MNTTSTKKSIRSNTLKIVALLWVTFQFYIAFYIGIPTIVARTVHVAFAASIVYLTNPLSKDDNHYAFILDMLCSVFFVGATIFAIYNGERYLSRMAYIDPVFLFDKIMAITFIVLLIEACRRVLGLSMTVVVLVFISYVFFGSSLPGVFRHRGIDFISFIELQFMTTNGIFGTASGVSVSTVFYFMIFGAFLSATPAGKLFISLAKFATRKAKGGEGKTTIIACGLFGMISGAASANVASTGMLTYPAMEKAGFRPLFAASVLAIAGAGGQLIPPIMGAAAFLMADLVGVSYFNIILYATIPSILYIMSLYFLVHFEAKRCNIISEPVDIPDLKKQIRNYFYLLVPLVILVGLIATGKSLMYSAVLSLIVLVVLCTFKADSRLSFMKILDTLIKGAVSAVIIAIPCAIAGIIVGILTHTGLGLKVSSMIAAMAGGNLLLALFLSMLMVIVLGMGMPTSAAYIMSAVILAPALQKLGVMPIVAHMFIFYFANLSMITPPVALASYTAAGVAKTPFWGTGIEAFKLSMVIFLIPYIFVFSPALLGIGTPLEILWVVLTTSVGLIAMAIALIGFYKYKVPMVMRFVLAALSIMLIIPQLTTDIIGLAAFAATIFFLSREEKKLIASDL